MEVVGVSQYYSGKNIFVTGATGFLGKALLEKLLRSCPDIGKIYTLIRPKREKILQERLDAVFTDPLYDTLKNEQPGVLEKKVIPLAGDVTQIGLGLSPEDRNIIVNEVSIIFHSAASVRFDDHLKESILINLRGAREVALLALEVKHLSIMVHISTAFVNCNILDVEERLYEAQADWKQMIEIAEKCDIMTLRALTDKILNGMPNTYTFTKSLGEHCVHDLLQGKVPLLIIRPSIVIATLKEPIPGWVDNFNGPVGILVAYGKGIMRTLYCHEDKRPDYIPVDVTIKAIIVASWDVALKGNSSDPEIIHCSSYKYSWLRLSHKELNDHSSVIGKDVPFNNILWTINGHTSNNKINVYFRIIFFHLLPLVILDEIIKLTGRKPFLKNVLRKIYSSQVALRFFINQEWNFHNDKMLRNQTKILEKDQKEWNYDFENFSIPEHAKNCLLGARRYLLKEPDDSIPQAQIHRARIYMADRIIKYVICFIILIIFFKLEFLDILCKKFNNIIPFFKLSLE